MLEKLKKIFKNQQKNKKIPNIVVREKRIKIPLNFRIKQGLRWFDLKDNLGNPLVHDDSNIKEIIDYWIKTLSLWILNIFVTGSLIYLAILPFYSVPIKLVPFTIFSIGLFYFVFMETLREIRNIIVRG